MKKYLVISILFLICTNSRAQIPNSSFENWSNGSTPDGWQAYPIFHTATFNSHSGTYAVK